MRYLYVSVLIAGNMSDEVHLARGERCACVRVLLSGSASARGQMVDFAVLESSTCFAKIQVLP